MLHNDHDALKRLTSYPLFDGKIQFIKAVRQAASSGLKEAKHFADCLFEGMIRCDMDNESFGNGYTMPGDHITSCQNVMRSLFRCFEPASQDEVDMLRRRNEVLEAEINHLNDQVRKGCEEVTRLNSVIEDYAKQTLDHTDVIQNLTEVINRLASISKRDALDDLEM